MLKKSIYNLVIDELSSGEVLLYNSLTGAFAALNSEIYEIYTNIETYGLFEQDDFEENYIPLLKANGFIVNDSADELNQFKAMGNISRFGSNTLNFTIATTTFCNMKCSYCFENVQESKLNEEVSIKLVDFLKMQLINKKIKVFNVVWFGGEPLLELNKINELSKQFIEICKQNNISYKSSVITNGILLNKETAKMLVNTCNIEYVQITLDGDKSTHNSRRIFKQGDGFETIINNIMECKDIIRIIVRINIDNLNKNIIIDLLNYLKTLKGFKETVYVYFAKVVGEFNYCMSNKKYDEVYIDLIEHLRTLNFKLSIENTYPKTSTIPCGAVSTNNFVIDPTGNLYTCYYELGLKERSIGNLLDGISLDKPYSDWLTVTNYMECDSCNVLPICNGGCPLDRLLNKPFKCTLEKNRCKGILKNYYSLMEN